jgi:hypothetical protein
MKAPALEPEIVTRKDKPVSDARFARRGLLVRPDAACLQWSASTSTRLAQIALSNFDSFQKTRHESAVDRVGKR